METFDFPQQQPNNEGGLLPIISLHDVQVVDSRLIAGELNLGHSDWFRNIVLKYQSDCEKSFGHLRFENGTVRNSVGAVNQVKLAYLSEGQALFFLTLSRNNEQVVKLKALLVKSFMQARNKSQTPLDALLATVQNMVDLRNRQDQTDQRLTAIEAKLETHNQDYYTLAGYYAVRGWKWEHDLQASQALGKQIKALSKTMDYEVHKTHDARYGSVNVYHKAVLTKYFDGVLGKQ